MEIFGWIKCERAVVQEVVLMVQVWKERHECYQCKRPMIVGITSWGSPHQSVHAIVCAECATEEDLALPTAAKFAKNAYDLESYMKWTPQEIEAHEKAIKEFLEKEKEQAQPDG
jgi:hypothetical protein